MIQDIRWSHRLAFCEVEFHQDKLVSSVSADICQTWCTPFMVGELLEEFARDSAPFIGLSLLRCFTLTASYLSVMVIPFDKTFIFLLGVDEVGGIVIKVERHRLAPFRLACFEQW